MNYEVDKTVRVVKGATGSIKRLTAAIVINHRMVLDPKTGKESSQPIPAEQITQMTALVRETIGFNKDRGDSVNLMNAPFNVSKVETVETPVWQQPEAVELARSFAWPIGMVVLGVVVLLGFVRPSLKMMSAPPPVPEKEQDVQQLEALVGDDTERPPLLPGMAPEGEAAQTIQQLQLADARRLALENPVAVANIIKGWVNGEPPAAA